MMYIGIDLGTSAVKLLLMEADGTIKKVVSKEYPLEFPRSGWSQQNPQDWEAQTFAGVRELLAGFDASQVAGIGVGPTLVTQFSLGAERSPVGRSAPSGRTVSRSPPRP